MANTGTPLAEYTNVVSGGLSATVKRLLPDNTYRYSLVFDGYDYFVLNLWVQEYYTIAEQEFTRWVYSTYQSPYKRTYYTLYVDLVNYETRRYKKKQVITVNKYKDEGSFYDETLKEKLGGEVVKLGE